MAKSPLQILKARFKDKAALVSAVQGLMTSDLWVDRLNGDKGLDSVSNKKLLHLHDVLSEVKTKFGSRAKLIDAVAAQDKRSGDPDYKKGLERASTPRLLELLHTGQKRLKKAS